MKVLAEVLSRISIWMNNVGGIILIKEGRINAGFKGGIGEGFSGLLEALHHKLISPVEIMDIARTMKEVEELPSLCYGAKQWIVSLCTFLHLIETNRRPCRMALGRLNRTIKVKGQGIKRFSLHPFDHHSRGQFTHPL